MAEPLIASAFIMGIVSACSLPLGTLTTLFWTPNDRAIGALMAFGGGALLAALTIDLVGSALERGHFNALAVGCILFVVLDKAVNDRGGFLRKSSTVIQYLRRQRRQRFKRALAGFERIDIFRDLSAEDIEDLASAVVNEEFEAGVTIYGAGDPADFLCIIKTGAVTLDDPKAGGQATEAVKAGASFGRRAFVTGAPHSRNAVATRDCRLWMLPREDFDRVLETSAALAQATETLARGDVVGDYLKQRHGLDDAAIAHWRASAVASLRGGGAIPNAVTIDRRHDEFVRISDGIQRIPIFHGLSPGDLDAIANHLFCVRFERGDTIFRQGQPAERMDIVEASEVALLDAADRIGRRMIIEDGEAFGGMSFLTNAHHTVNAIATDDCVLWVLRKPDFDLLLNRFPGLLDRVRAYLEDAQVSHYLKGQQGLEAAKVARWIKHATCNVDSGRLIPSVDDMIEHMGQHTGAPMAIWLGIMLDGIPESLVIGSSMFNAHVSLSLIAGLFLSNYHEALSSSVGMRQQGMGFARVFFMWTSLIIFTGLGAAVGNVYFVGADAHAFALVEGIAAGAMLTMIAQTIAPEAYLKGGSLVGLATLMGFLIAIFFKTLE